MTPTDPHCGEIAQSAARCWKLTRSDHKTYDDTLWGEGVEHSVPEWTGKLCTGGVIHAYQDPWLAVVMKPVHGYGSNFDNCIFWEAEATGRRVVAPDKIGCETVRTIRQVKPPMVTVEQRVEIAIRCAMVILPDHEWAQTWRAWAEKWLSGEDRSHKSAVAISDGIYDAARRGAVGADAARAAARAAAHADNSATNAAVNAAASAVHIAVIDCGIDPVDIIHRVCGGQANSERG